MIYLIAYTLKDLQFFANFALSETQALFMRMDPKGTWSSKTNITLHQAQFVSTNFVEHVTEILIQRLTQATYSGFNIFLGWLTEIWSQHWPTLWDSLPEFA